jgi:uncharacterized protein YutE (UPF0331/DUF86 family)
MLDKDFIERKIKLITEDMEHLREFQNYSLDDLAKDFIKQAAAERFLERIIIRTVDINNHLIAELGKGTEEVRGYYDTFIVLANFRIYSENFAKQIAENVKFRNLLVHEYNKIDKTLIHKKIKEVLDDFGKYLNYILKFIEKINIK